MVFGSARSSENLHPSTRVVFSPAVMSRGMLDLTYPLYNFSAMNSIQSRVFFDLAARRNIRNTQNIDDVSDV